MKKIIRLIALTLSLAAASACFNLDEEWYSEVTPDTYFQSKEDIYSVLYRPFTHAFWYEGIDRWYLQEYTADQMVQPQRGNDWYDGGLYFRMHYHTWTEDDNTIWQTWRGTGMGISLTTECQRDLQALDYTKFGLTEADKVFHQNQLNTLIAYFYLRALDYFGPFPIMEDPLKEIEYRSTDRKVYAKVESMLHDALETTPMATEDDSKMIGMSRGTAATLLARLYFNAEAYIGEDHYDDCAELCQDIIDGVYGYYKLGDSWKDTRSLTNKDSKAVIWAHPSQMNYIENNWWFKYTHHKNMVSWFGVDNVNAYNGHGLTPSLKPDGTPYTGWHLGSTYSKFNDSDLRKRQYHYNGGTDYEGMFLVGAQETDDHSPIRGNKEYNGKPLVFVDYIARMSEKTDAQSASDLRSTMEDGEENSCIRPVPIPIASENKYRWASYMVVLRLEEVYYMLAECKMRAGDLEGAANLINQVRSRAFAGGADPDPVTKTNLDKWRMLDEWGIEFLCEGRRRTDLIRWGVFTTESWWDHTPSDPSRNRFPVPTRAISGNNNLQLPPQ
ncbi:MAG: RagB/SusD family nutrient uptake outer membrane protein [Bacteroidales bacterium]|nr:RagB/SusD family nutrient uptake outer membrane protein [Bacteroidales bacterium]